MNSNKNDDLSKKFISDDKFLKSNQFADSMDTETIMKLLKEKPYLLNQPQEKFGFTLLYIAVVNKNYNLCEFLLENNADPNLKNIYGETPLHQAIEIENNKIINLLLEKGADPNSTNNDGETPMHIAAIKGNYKIVKLLLIYGASPYVRTFKSNYSPFDYAAESNQIKVVNLLKPLMETERGNSPNNPSFNEAKGFRSTKTEESPINILKPVNEMSYAGLGQFNINNTTKNTRNNILNQDSFHDRTKSYTNSNNNMKMVDNFQRESNSRFENTKDNFSLSFMNHVTMFEAKIEKIKNDLANINSENFLQGFSKNNNLVSLNSNEFSHQNYQSHHKTNTVSGGNFFGTFYQNGEGSNLASPNNVNLSNEMKNAMKNHKKNTISVDNSLYNSIENLYPTFNASNNSQNMKHRLMNNSNNLKESFNNKISTFNEINNQPYKINNNFMNIIRNPPSNDTTLKKSDKYSYTFKPNESRVITLKPEDLGESYEKPINSNHEESRITYNTNCNNVEEVFNLPLQQKNLNHNIISEQFWKDIESGREKKGKKVVNKLRISENFYDDQKILAIFSSSSNDIITDEVLQNHYHSSGKEQKYEWEIVKSPIDKRQYNSGYNMYLNNKNISLNQSEEKIFTEQNLTSKRNVKYFSKKSGKNSEKQISLDIHQSVHDDIPYKNNINHINEKNQETEFNLQTESSKEIFNFLSKLELEMYTKYFLKNGFDDMNVITDQLKNGYGLTDHNLKEIGIKSPGVRAKILIKLEEGIINTNEDEKMFNFHIPMNTYYNIQDEYLKNNDINENHNLKNLKDWLCQIKVENMFQNFIENGYHSLELLLIQMLSRNPLTDKILEEDLNIKKIGYRVRILNKLKSDSKLYVEKCKGNELHMYDKKNSIKDPCKCIIY